MDRRLLRTKRNIRAALLELLKRKTLNDITITELSELADIDRKTFYLHYNIVQDVVVEMESEVAEEVRNLLSAQKNLDLKLLIEGLNAIMNSNLEFYKLIAADTSISFLKGQCKDILKAELKNAFFEKSNLKESVYMVYAEYVSSGIIGVYIEWLVDDAGLSLEDLTGLISNAVVHAWNEIVCGTKRGLS